METPKGIELTPAPTLVVDPINEKEKSIIEEAEVTELANTKALRKYALLAVFCLGQFLDTMNNSAMFPAIPAISHQVGLTESDSVWLFAAYQATFASFLLISGRISDVYNPKPVFILGTAFFGLISLGGGFINDKIPLLVLRALQGIGASLTIPSSLNLIIQLFPDPQEQSRAIGLFGAMGAIGNVLGTIVGAVLVNTLHGVICIILIPKTAQNKENKKSTFDFVGVFLLTVRLFLALAVAFFFWEARIDEDSAALPPKLWFYKNFAVLFGVALMPYFWWVQIYLTFSAYWQDHLHWSSIIAGVKFLPLGIVAGPIMVNAGRIARIGQPKWMILGGLTAAFIATILLPFSDRPHDRYWPLDFPAFIIGTAGTSIAFVLTNINIFRTTPSRYAGTVGAVFNAALQLGSAIGTSATTSIQASVDVRNVGKEGSTGFEGRSAALWFLLAWVGLEIIGVAVFFQRSAKSPLDEEAAEGKAGPKVVVH
ncbi:major facilitator superfamily transporter [Rhizoctonia solani]|uniref:Major facilitator superfamily transporter n=1 Tax=Rhizoctonia solani TaxID=456999 RepID=A0A8H8NR18_9AGAM|nr:major facilitator superfamily transporter [Rhizoctonia solani]QRW17197.1 major facilitator superfamily transporter [Rhizoctonia solani]